MQAGCPWSHTTYCSRYGAADVGQLEFPKGKELNAQNKQEKFKHKHKIERDDRDVVS
jgi:hypothetical protein